MAKSKDGAPGIDAVTFEALEEGGGENFLKQIQDERVQETYQPLRVRKRKFRKTGAPRSAFSPFLPCVTVGSREHSGSSWSRSSKLIYNRGRIDTDRAVGWPKSGGRTRPGVTTSCAKPTDQERQAAERVLRQALLKVLEAARVARFRDEFLGWWERARQEGSPAMQAPD
jgi:hypothetical protein